MAGAGRGSHREPTAQVAREESIWGKFSDEGTIPLEGDIRDDGVALVLPRKRWCSNLRRHSELLCL